MRRKRMRLVSLISSAVCLLGCAVQPARSRIRLSPTPRSLPMQQVRPSRTKRSARWPNLCCRKQKMEAMHPRAASLLSGRVRRIRIKPRKNSLYPLKRHRPLHRKSRQYPRLHRRINLLPHPHRHLHRNRQRNRGSNLRLSPNLPLRLSLPPAGTSTLLRRLSGRVTSMQERSAA